MIPSGRSLADLPETSVRLLEQLCDGFERAWQAALRRGADRPRLEELLVRLSAETRAVGLAELLRVEWNQRRQHGERPDASEYAERFPEMKAALPALFAEDGCAPRTPPFPGDVEAVGLTSAEREGIPGYRLMRRLGGGGMGDVFLASQLFSTPDDALRTVALKAIRPELLTSPPHRLIMENDIRIAALLDHPNIVRILHVGPADGALYYTMPYFKGGSLAERIDRKPLPSRASAELLLPVTRAVAYLHTQRAPVIHLDLKPGNILLDADGNPHVADFGLARLLQSADGQRVTRRPGGTPEYMAPEQFEGWVSAACDIYGLGAILYEMLTGRPPFVGATWGETMRQAREQEPVPPRALNAGVDRGLEAVCLKCLEKDPKDRYRTAGELADDLQRVLEGETPKAFRTGWPEWLRRQLNREIRFEAAGPWSAALLWQAAVSLPAYLSAYAFLWLGCPAPVFWLWLLVLLPAAEWGPHFVLRRGRRYDPREREIILLWVSVCIAKAILFGLNCPLLGPVRPEEVYRFFPASMAVSGLMLCLEGRLYMGRLYLFGLLDFVVAPALAARLDLAPLLFGVWNSLVLVWMGLHMRRRAREYAANAVRVVEDTIPTTLVQKE
jgi:eukaryotic-like serine/threonine-protein kinase